MARREGDRIVETTTEARAGVKGFGARYVLFASTIGCVLAFILVFWYFFR
jgi:hypothetical protein